MATRHKGIIAYGTELDRQKLAVLAELSKKSGSEYVIDLIRRSYTEVMGETSPEVILKNH